MLDAALTALAVFADPGRLALLLAGVLAGIVVGIMPGMGGIQIVRSLQGRSLAGDEGPPSPADLRSGLVGFLALGGFFVLLWLIGFHVAATALMLFFTLGQARMRPIPALLFTAITLAFLTVFGTLLGVHWPEGVLRAAP